MLKETCSLFRHLILDDDVRIEFSKAHEHARTIAADVLIELTTLLPIHMKDKNILSDLLLTIATLTVRHEFCVQVQEAGGLKFISDCIVSDIFYTQIKNYSTENVLKPLNFSTNVERARKFNTRIKRIIEIVACIGWK